MLEATGAPMLEPGFDQAAPEDWTQTITADPNVAGIHSLKPAPYTYFQADVVFLKRSAPDSAVYAVDDSLGLSTPVLNTGDMSFGNFQPGVAFTLGRQIDGVSSIEVGYLGLQNFTASAQAVGNNNLSVPGLLALSTSDYFLADIVNASYETQFNSAEITYKQTMYGLTFLGGFRYLNLNDSLQIGFDDFDSGKSDYVITTNNNLYGAQIGTGWHGDWDRLQFDFLGKAGVYGNQAYQTNYLRDVSNTVELRNRKDNQTTAAFVGELQAMLAYQITDWLLIRGGYRIIWVGGVVQAPGQLDFGDSALAGSTISRHTDMYMHGFNGGLEIRW